MSSAMMSRLFAGAAHSLEHGHDVLHVGDLLVGHEDVGSRARPPSIVISDEVSGDVALVELHALDGVDLDVEGLAVLDGDDAVLAHDVHGVGDLLANVGVTSGDGADGGDLLLGETGCACFFISSTAALTAFCDAAADGQGVGAGGHVAQAVDTMA